MLHIDCRGRETGEEVPLFVGSLGGLCGQVSDNRQGLMSVARRSSHEGFVLEVRCLAATDAEAESARLR